MKQLEKKNTIVHPSSQGDRAMNDAEELCPQRQRIQAAVLSRLPSNLKNNSKYF
jgi:hypothetical protein